MKKNVIILCCAGILVGCTSQYYHNEYDNVCHKGIKSVRITNITADTVCIDGSSTSLEGEWALHNGRLYFTDYNLVGIKEFDLNGGFVARHIHSGRGPNEWMMPFVVSCFDSDNNLIGIDGSWNMIIFDSTYKKVIAPFPYLSDLKYNRQDWSRLLFHPDVDESHMYEFNVDSRDVKILGGELIIPIVTEHVNFNGYDIGCNAEDFWRNSYLYIFIDLKKRITGNKFGHYPLVYTTRNIPVFSKYSFDVSEDKLYTSFAADSLIYVRDSLGAPIYTIGYGSSAVKDDYPETRTFDIFREKYQDYLKRYSYYQNLKIVGSYIFRSYKYQGDEGYGLQVYFNYDLIGDIKTAMPVFVIGTCNDLFYAALPADLENDCFRLIKFKL